LHQPLRLRHTNVDETRHGWDNAPACVLGTVWGAALIQTCYVWIGTVPVLNEDRSLAHLFDRAVVPAGSAAEALVG
jgi:hypothetical protein